MIGGIVRTHSTTHSNIHTTNSSKSVKGTSVGCRSVKQPLSEEIKRRRAEIRIQAQALTHQTAKLPQIKSPVTLTHGGIKEWTNQPHKYAALKNEMLLNVFSVIKKAKYLGHGQDKHDRTAKAHLYQIEIGGEPSWIIVRELADGQAFIHGISDSPSIVEKVLK